MYTEAENLCEPGRVMTRVHSNDTLCQFQDTLTLLSNLQYSTKIVRCISIYGFSTRQVHQNTCSKLVYAIDTYTLRYKKLALLGLHLDHTGESVSHPSTLVDSRRVPPTLATLQGRMSGNALLRLLRILPWISYEFQVAFVSFSCHVDVNTRERVNQ